MKTKTLPLKDCYRILGVPKGTSLEDIKHAYRKRAFELHPDLNPEAGASRKFQELNEAYSTLIHHLEEQGDQAPPNAEEDWKAKAAHNAHDAYKEQVRREREQRQAEEKERRRRQEEARRQREEELRRERERRLQAERERYEAQRRERLKREIERQEEERLARQAKAKEEREQQMRARAEAERAREERLREQAARAETYRREYVRAGQPDLGNAGGPQATPPQGAAPQGSSGNAQQTKNDVLTDPNARKVYEQSHSEVQNHAEPAEHKPRKFQMEWGDHNFSLDLTGGVGHAVKGWLRGQIDQKQELFFPASQLHAGARIRLQIRSGLSGGHRTVEITLPQDFVVGKPVRLKGMGKKFGRWQGDLYLTFQIKE